MAEVSLDRRFTGQARLVRLLLWRVGDSTDVQACLAAAREKHMIDEADEAFLRACLDAEERQREDAAARRPALPLDAPTIERLQRCADKLNRADSA